MSSLSEEEENYVRMSLLLTGLSPRAVRAFFDREFPSTYLPSILSQKYNTLLRLQKNRVINQAQWNLLFPPRVGVADSKTFDVTLMICLIRNLTSVTPPAAGFDCLPSSEETTPGADIARIKHYRNYLAHLDVNKIDHSVFITAWHEISDAVKRLGGTSMYCECQDLKTKNLDQSNHEVMLEMKTCMAKVEDLTTEMKELRSNHEEKIDDLKAVHAKKAIEIEKLKADQDIKTKEIEQLKETVPWNIKEQITRQLDTWNKKDQRFVETRAAGYVLQSMKENSCVTVTASSGVGKTFTVRHVALQMAAEGYNILPVTSPEEIVKYYNPNKKILYVIDDLCGTYTLNKINIEKWKTTHYDIKRLLKKETAKIISSCRLQVYQDEQFKQLPLFTTCECNLLSEDCSLSKEEKILIANQYLKSDAGKISEYVDLFDFFPLLCTLYNENPALNIVEFFKNPFSVYELEIDKLHTEQAYGKYCALALCVIFNNRLKEEWLTEDVNQDIQGIIENTCEVCRLNRGTSRLVLLDELNSLINTFLKKEQGSYCTIHDKLFDFLSFYFGRTHILPCLIKNGESEFISERFVFDKQNNSDTFITIVPEKYQEMYIQRMLGDWSKGEVSTVFTNINMKSPLFRNKFLTFLKKLDVTYQKQLATKRDYAANIKHLSMQECNDIYNLRMNTPLLHCCDLGDINMVEWCCGCGADVNYCSNDGVSPLFIACKGGFTDIVTKLVNKKAKINKCTEYGESPLFIACKGGYTDIVAYLVNKKAYINEYTEYGEYPLYIACKKGYTNIVTKLVDNKADINMCRDEGESPLYVACKRGFTDIVTKLLDNKADINLCRKRNVESPLYIACRRGLSDIVIKVVDNTAYIKKWAPGKHHLKFNMNLIEMGIKLLYIKADVNKCISDKGALYIAGERIFSEIVTRLVDNKADFIKYTDIISSQEESPLYIACKGGFTDIVTKLVDYKADINKCTRRGESPLYIACSGGFTDIVSKLMDNKADIYKCTKWGESPLFIACEGGFTDIVTMLIGNKGNINQCTMWGESPLYIACCQGFKNIVTKLLENKANINKQTTKYRESSLYIACKEGFTDIVTNLVDNKADINKCTSSGESPLYTACKGGFTDIVSKLLENNADINMCTEWGGSPLLIACKGGFTDIVNKLLGNKVDINRCTDWGGSPLYIACKGGFPDIVTKLLDNKADINKNTTNYGESSLYIACKGGFTDIVINLLDKKAEINKCTKKYGESPLYIACKGGFTDIATKLVDNKADVNKCTSCGESPLYTACKGGFPDIVAKLLENNSDVNMSTERGESPLYIACKGGFPDLVTMLLENKANINKGTNKYGESPLYIACKGGFTDIVIMLLDNKAEINRCTKKYGESPLYVACLGGFTGITTKLVENKADMNRCTYAGKSPLYIACKQGFIEIVEILISKGADYTKVYNNGHSLLDIAKLEGHDMIVDYVCKRLSDQNFF